MPSIKQKQTKKKINYFTQKIKIKTFRKSKHLSSMKKNTSNQTMSSTSSISQDPKLLSKTQTGGKTRFGSSLLLRPFEVNSYR